MLFAVGKVRVSKQVLEDEAIPVPDIVNAFGRYIRGDWGDLATDQGIANDVALTSGEPIVAHYHLVQGKALVMTTTAGETVIGESEEACGRGTTKVFREPRLQD